MPGCLWTRNNCHPPIITKSQTPFSSLDCNGFFGCNPRSPQASSTHKRKTCVLGSLVYVNFSFIYKYIHRRMHNKMAINSQNCSSKFAFKHCFSENKPIFKLVQCLTMKFCKFCKSTNNTSLLKYKKQITETY